jgi:DNA end-binding protein Ku
MPRAVWTGSLSFGLVSIPVALYPATQPKDVRFHLFDRHGRRVRYRRFAEDDHSPLTRPVEAIEGPTVEDLPGDGFAEAPASETSDERHSDEHLPAGPLGYDELVRGYEVEPGRFAMLEHEEVEQARPTRSSTIDLEDFVELDAIDPVYFEKSYYLAPRHGADTPYRLLQRALQRSRRVGIGRFVLRTKPHLVAVRPNGDVLGLETLFFGDEVRAAADVVPSADGDVSERELRLAEQLVEMLATAWEPERYADEYRRELHRIISEKDLVDTDATNDRAATQKPTPRVEELMEALKRSVEEAKAERQGGASRSRRKIS